MSLHSTSTEARSYLNPQSQTFVPQLQQQLQQQQSEQKSLFYSQTPAVYAPLTTAAVTSTTDGAAGNTTTTTTGTVSKRKWSTQYYNICVETAATPIELQQTYAPFEPINAFPQICHRPGYPTNLAFFAFPTLEHMIRALALTHTYDFHRHSLHAQIAANTRPKIERFSVRIYWQIKLRSDLEKTQHRLEIQSRLAQLGYGTDTHVHTELVKKRGVIVFASAEAVERILEQRVLWLGFPKSHAITIRSNNKTQLRIAYLESRAKKLQNFTKKLKKLPAQHEPLVDGWQLRARKLLSFCDCKYTPVEDDLTVEDWVRIFKRYKNFLLKEARRMKKRFYQGGGGAGAGSCEALDTCGDSGCMQSCETESSHGSEYSISSLGINRIPSVPSLSDVSAYGGDDEYDDRRDPLQRPEERYEAPPGYSLDYIPSITGGLPQPTPRIGGGGGSYGHSNGYLLPPTFAYNASGFHGYGVSPTAGFTAGNLVASSRFLQQPMMAAVSGDSDSDDECEDFDFDLSALNFDDMLDEKEEFDFDDDDTGSDEDE